MIWRIWQRLSHRADRAGSDADRSSRALAETQEKVIRPLARQQADNEFARLISDGIRRGYGGEA